MPRRSDTNGDRTRALVAQEAARLIVDQGIRDYGIAKKKAAEKLNLATRGALPGNHEIEQAIADHLSLFAGDDHVEILYSLRRTALIAMQMLEEFTPRLVGPVLSGTADDNSAVNMHLFSDSPELVAFHLGDRQINFRNYERRLKTRRNVVEIYPGYEFRHEYNIVQATVFPYDGLRQAPISPIDGKPMKRADMNAVQVLMEEMPAGAG
ncbi:MAG: hypothetical protein QNJ19_09230 [Woeseiaceae bacterium]|nr:hypothetical protein [Woeseiaceae bacterium]